MELTIKDEYKNTKVGLIPNDWRFELLDRTSKRGSGHTPKKKEKSYYDGTIVWVSLADSNRLDRGLINSSTITISPKGIANSSAVLHPKGIVLMSRDAGIGKSAVAGISLCVSQHFITWECHNAKLHNWFLYYWLQFQKKEFERIAIGSTIKTIGLPYFKKYQIPLPSTLTEQKAIATALSDVDALIATLEQTISKKKAIKQGAMQQLLTPPDKGGKRLPGFSGEWIEINLGKSSTLKARIGWQGLTTAEYLKAGEYYLITGTDFKGGYIEWEKCVCVEKNRFDQDRNIQIMPEDVLVTKDGTIGKVAYIDKVPKPTTLNSGVFVIRPMKEAYYPRFFYCVLMSEHFDNFLGKLTAGSTISHLYQKDFVHYSFPVPPSLEEQKAISDILLDMDSEIQQLESKKSKYQAIKQGMMQELLTGRTRLI